jgi:anhydro-N-acetylmuramic acid kinase
MNPNEVFSIGLMSGTSLDGLDLVYVKFNKNEYQDFKIINAETIPYSKVWKKRLQKAVDCSKDELTILNIEYAELLAERINYFFDTYGIGTIDFISSHGHTVLHQPENGTTLQIGDGQIIANKTGQKVICDFRTQDVALGGQGAPLVPIGDELLFSEYDYCVNLGGFSNVSYKKNTERIAFDICPVNIVMNHYANKMDLLYDASGKIAASGEINHLLLAKLNKLAFYEKEAPKSLGLEWVKSTVFPLIDEFENDIPTILRTFVAHVATQISKNIKPKSNVLFTGGGVFNLFLMHEIQRLAKIEIAEISEEIIDFKEALIFAFLGLLKDKNEINCLKSVTGAEKNHSSGEIFYPQVLNQKL